MMRPGDEKSDKRQKERDAGLAAAAAANMKPGTRYLIQPTSISDIDSIPSYTGVFISLTDTDATFADVKKSDGTDTTPERTFNRSEYGFAPDTGGRRRRNTKKSKRRTRRRTSTIRMKKSAYLREHHHLFRVLQNPTRRALNAELRDQKRELARRGLKE